MGSKAPELVWLVTVRVVEGANQLQLHAIRTGVTLCGLSAQTCAWFDPEIPDRSRPCQTCLATVAVERQLEKAKRVERQALKTLRRKGVRVSRADGHLMSNEVVEAAKITYRQLDYWCKLKLVQPSSHNPGSGVYRYFAPTEVAIVIRMAELVAVGLSLEVAHRAAINNGQLADGVRVVVDRRHRTLESA